MIFQLIFRACLMALLFGATPVIAQTDWRSANLTVVDQHLLPSYQRLANSTQALSEQAQQFCNDPNKTTLAPLRAAFHSAMDDWMGIQHMRFGPVDLYLRYSRYQLWPDKHGTGAKQLKSLLAEQPNDQLTPDRFPYTSVAVQGFTSLERLLFPSQLDLASFGAARQPSFQCELVVAIASNLANITEGIVHDWSTGKINYRFQIESAEQGNDYFESSEEVSSRFLNDLYTQLQSIVDQKLMRPLENHQLRRAESWRSRRSLRNIELNLQGIEELYRVGFSPLVTDQTLDAEIKAAFADAIQSIRAVKSPLYDISKDSESLELVQRVLADCRKLKSLIATRLTVALNLPLGFNSLDGD